jgi:glycerol-3-phosphate dehydrogenase (NAD(P)+)
MKQEPLSGDPLPSHAHPYSRAAVIGAGSWGTALAATLARGAILPQCSRTRTGDLS